jgi:hypothetical protein
MFGVFCVYVCFGNVLRRLLIKETRSFLELNLLVRPAVSILGQIATLQGPPSPTSGSMITPDDFRTFILRESFES